MATTPNYSFVLPTVGGSSGVWGGNLNANWTSTDSLLSGGTPVTGIDINSGSIDGATIGAATKSTGAFTTLSASGTITFGGVDLTATGTEINYLDGVTSNIQTQLNASGAGDVTLTGTQTLTNKTLTSPVLGGTTTTASGNMIVSPATQIVEVKGDGSSVEGQIKLNCHANTHGQTLKSQPHSVNATNTMLLPEGANSTLVSKVSVDTLTNKTVVDTVYALSGLALLATNGGVQTKTVGAAITLTDSLVSGDAIVLMLEAGASYTVTWPTMQWVTSAGNVAPTLTAKDTIVLWKVGSVLHGAYTGSYV